MKKFLYILLASLPLVTLGQTNPFCGTFTPSGPIVRTGVSNQRISGFIITPVAGQPLMSLTNCHDIVIAVNIFPGGCAAGQDALRAGIALNNCYNITIDSNRFTQVSSGVLATNCTGNIKVLYNQFQNMTGPFPRGEAVQFNTVSGSGNQINYNNIENLPGVSLPEDGISLYKSNGVLGSPIQVIGNQMRCGGNTSSSGEGITLGDNGGNYQVARNNILVNPGHAQIGIVGGNADSIINNTCITNDLTLLNAVGIQAYNATGGGCTNAVIINNQIYCIQASGFQNPFYIPGTCSPILNTTNNWHAALTTGILPAVLIPTCTVAVPAIAYTPGSYTLSISSPISAINAVSTGGTPTLFSLSPAQPGGINFNTSTGQVTGTPTVLSPQTTYTVTASNSTGSSSAPLTLTVINNPPVISYSPGSQTCTIGVAMTTMTPVNSGGSATSYTIAPALPAGMSFNTGVISGTPSVLSSSAVYTVTAFNSGGTSTASVTLSVIPAAPAIPSISYSPATVSLPVNVAISAISPVNTGGLPASYANSVALPSGLSFNTSTGVISGTPTVTSSAVAHDISATNVSGTAHTTLTISVTSALPAAPVIAYSPANVAFVINRSLSGFSPSNTGGNAASWSISPALPTGLVFNTSTGIISGTPTVLSGTVTYNVSATNTGGTGHFSLTVTVVKTSGSIKKISGGIIFVN